MQIHLTRFPVDMVRGIYKVGGVDGRMPDRMRMLESGACAESFARIAGAVVVSDMFRTAESSLEAMQRKKGVQPPSFSHHNYGRAIDLDVRATMKSLKAKSKGELDGWMSGHGWYCFRGDGKTGRTPTQPYDESWHYDYLGDLPAHERPVYPYRTDRNIAWAACQSRYAGAWRETIAGLARPGETRVAASRCQTMLAGRGFYHGAIDGLIGPQTRSAVGALQRAWKLPETGKLDAKTVQVLTYVSAERVITEMVELPAAAAN